MFVGKYLDFIHKNKIKSQLLNYFNNKSRFDSQVKIQREDPTWNCELIHDQIIDHVLCLETRRLLSVAHGTLSYGISEMGFQPKSYILSVKWCAVWALLLKNSNILHIPHYFS